MPIYFNGTDYPNLDSAVIGVVKNNGYGELSAVPAAGIVTGATSLLTTAINDTVTSLTVDDPTRFPATPFIIQINAERLNVTNKAGSVFTVTRGYDGTEAVTHSNTQTVFEVLTEYIYHYNDASIDEITTVYIDDIKQDAANYTAYTGQAGDAHTDWPGISVIAFSADSYIGKQYNVTEEDIAASETIVGRVDFASDPSLTTDDDDAVILDTAVNAWGTVVGLKGEGVKTQAFVKFKSDFGDINTQTYFIDLENDSDDLDPIDIYVMVTEGDDIKLSQPVTIPKQSGNMTIEVSREDGIFDDVLRVYSYSSDLIIKDMRKNVLLQPAAIQADPALNETQEVAVLQQILIDTGNRFATYPDTEIAGAIIKQTHYVEFVDTSGNDEIIELSISAVEKNGTVLKSKVFNISGSSTYSLSITHDAGSYDTGTRVIVNNLPLNSIGKMKIKKVIEYATDQATTVSNISAASSGKIVIGNQVTADGKFAVDTTGDYGGSGSLIQRPDWVIKHFLVNEKGAALGDIDTTSFSDAGDLYTAAISGGYKLNFLWSTNFGEDEMAEQCRSVIYMTKGKYYLDFIPDTAPAAVATITDAKTMGPDGFIFNHGRIEELHTNYTARYGLKSDGTWGGVVSAVDTGNKYGTRNKRIDLGLITFSLMAQDVLAHILLQHQALYKTVIVTVSWKYRDLQVGDTFDISSTLHNNMKFFVENLKLNSNNTITITGKEWW